MAHISMRRMAVAAMMVVATAGCGGNTRSRPARALDRETTLKRITVENGGGASAVIYTIIADGRSVRVDQGKIPRKIVGLVANLTGLITRYEP